MGKDVARALGYGDGKSLANAIADHVAAEDKGVTEMVTPGGRQKMTIINESGLYSLIFCSKLESAMRFKRWVTSEVLPSIRKTGGYTMPKLSKEMQALFLLDDRTQKQEARITALENTMTVDYSQQQALKKAVGRVVVEALGGKAAPAYNDPMCAASCSASATATCRTGSGSTACATYPARISPRLWSTSSAGSPAPTP